MAHKPPSQTHYLITGGAGFIGSHLVELLLAAGVKPNHIRILVQPGESLKNLPKLEFPIIEADIRDQTALKTAVQGVDVVYHLAARTIDGTPYTDYLEVNAGATKLLLKAIKDQPIRKFILFSSIAVFGLPAFTGPLINVDENSPKHPGEIYGQSKLAAEKVLLQAHRQSGIPYAIIRPTSVYGPRDIRNLYELYRIIAKHLFILIGSGHNKMDYVYVKDLVAGARLAELSPLPAGDYIIGGHRTLTLAEVAQTVAASLNTSIPPFYLPTSLALPLSRLSQRLFALIGTRSPIYPDRVKVMTSDCYFNITKAKTVLGYQPAVSFKQGTQATAKWLRSHGGLA